MSQLVDCQGVHWNYIIIGRSNLRNKLKIPGPGLQEHSVKVNSCLTYL